MQTRSARLVLVGAGPETERIMAEARRCRVADRLLMPGGLADPAAFLGCFDIFASSSDGASRPTALLEAMAAGLPIAATAAGELAATVAPDNRPLIVAPDDEAALTAALDTLSERSDLRQGIGRANREKARADFDEKAMIVRYARLYGEAMGAPQTFLAALA
jgi:glycosyltransferase involved in cell wall biosynthesis